MGWNKAYSLNKFMDTKTIIYVVAAALVLRVIIKVIVRFYRESNAEVNKLNNNGEEE